MSAPRTRLGGERLLGGELSAARRGALSIALAVQARFAKRGSAASGKRGGHARG